MNTFEVQTPSGPARVHLESVADPVGALALGHGAGGGVNARDLVAAAGVAVSLGFTVALVEQPYRVAGRRSSPPAPRLDEAWLAVMSALRSRAPGDVFLVVGGRSAGARVACRTAAQAGAGAVLCLAFPLLPPGRRGGAGQAPPSRLPELDGVAVPTLVVQGESDPFGMPPAAPPRRIVAAVPGTHSFTAAGVKELSTVVGSWLDGLIEGQRQIAHAKEQ